MGENKSKEEEFVWDEGKKKEKYSNYKSRLINSYVDHIQNPLNSPKIFTQRFNLNIFILLVRYYFTADIYSAEKKRLKTVFFSFFRSVKSTRIEIDRGEEFEYKIACRWLWIEIRGEVVN